MTLREYLFGQSCICGAGNEEISSHEFENRFLAIMLFNYESYSTISRRLNDD